MGGGCMMFNPNDSVRLTEDISNGKIVVKKGTRGMIRRLSDFYGTYLVEFEITDKFSVIMRTDKVEAEVGNEL